MNERVRELARRVVGKNKNDVGSISLFDEQIEQFAELIVRECLTFVEPMPGSGDIDDLALEAAREGIKEHFGVEE
jgi:hypothetical protein